MAIQKTVQSHNPAKPEGRKSTESCEIAVASSLIASRLQHSLPYLQGNPFETLEVCMLDQHEIYF
jgi:hypothetical protein